MQPSKKNRRKLCLDDKKKIIEEADINSNKTYLAKKFGVPRTTIIGILNQKNEIKDIIKSENLPKRVKIRSSRNKNLENGILMWFRDMRSQNIPVSGLLIQAKAKELATKLDIADFNASNGWLEKFLSRNLIVFKTNQGEAKDINLEELSCWQESQIQNALKEYQASDIFNVDETALFWRLLPNKTLAFKGERCTDGKQSKERITVLVGANMTGDEKLPLLVIGKSLKPRCFKNSNLPVQYNANKKAWMTANIFEEWLKVWDCKLRQNRRKIILFIDNCTAHPAHLNLRNIKLKFFPPNTTAVSQPMDQGIIKNLKIHYKRYLLRRKIVSIENKMEFTFNLLDALHLLRRAWDDVTAETINRCFEKAKFITNRDLIEDDVQIDNAELIESWELLIKNAEIEKSIALNDYIHADNDIITSGLLSLNDIVASLTETSSSSEENNEMEIKEEELISISNKEAQKALDIVRRYVEKNFNDPKVLKLVDNLDDALIIQSRKEMKQKSLFDYKITSSK